MPASNDGVQAARAPLLVGLDCALLPASVAVTRGEETVAFRRHLDDGRADAWLGAAIDECLAEAGLTLRAVDGFAVTIGPGAFTGIRVGIATALGLAAPTRRPVAGVQTLEALAESARPQATRIAACVDARRGQVYGAAFDLPTPPTLPVAPTSGPVVSDPKSFARRLAALGLAKEAPPVLIGSGAAAVAEHGDFRVAPTVEVAAAAAARLAARTWGDRIDAPPRWPAPVPLYVRPPDAKPPRNVLLEGR